MLRVAGLALGAENNARCYHLDSARPAQMAAANHRGAPIAI